MRKILSLAIVCFVSVHLVAQNLPDSCKLKIGTNVSALFDYSKELPFVDLMRSARVWYTKDVGNPNGGPFDTQAASQLTYRPDGYPTHLPQNIAGFNFPQAVATIWDGTLSWPTGTYHVLFDGTGTISLWGNTISAVTQVDANTVTFNMNTVSNGTFEIKILSSDSADPVHNMRVIMPGHLNTYTTQPFYPLWLEKVKLFHSVRFMDWGSTNGWGQPDAWTWDDPSLFNWDDRAKMDYYTWTNGKGVPYEMMIKLMNDHNLDGWVCVPHRADNTYIQNMAQLFKDNLKPERKLYVEYSNEIWNWMFGQTQWLNKYGCTSLGISWPEGIVPYIQNCMNIWTTVYGNQIHRINRVVGVQAAWQDVSNRVVFNMTPGSFDSFSPSYYFGLSDQADAALDALGSSATVANIAHWARVSRENEKQWLISQKQTIADSLNIPMVFYEGGQHLTAHPFGVMPTYSNALLAIQRDTAMYNLYNEWYDFVRTLQSGSEPLLLMNFSLIGARSAQYGSWGILESMNQDTSQIPAPKFKSTIENMSKCGPDAGLKVEENLLNVLAYPNPFHEFITFDISDLQVSHIQLLNDSGQIVKSMKVKNSAKLTMDFSDLSAGNYLAVFLNKGKTLGTAKIIKN